MGVLDVEHRVVLGLLHRLVEVEVERRVVLAGQHDEAGHVGADLDHQVAERDEGAGAFRHLEGLAALEEADELAELDVERHAVLRERGDGGAHALDVAAVVGAEDVDELVVAALDLVEVVGDVGGEVGPAAVGLLDRAVGVVAVGGGAEEGLLARLPVLGELALRRLERALVDEAVGVERGDAPPRCGRCRRATSRRRSVSMRTSRSARSSRIIAIIASVANMRTSASQSCSPLSRRLSPYLRLQRLADRDQVVAGIEALGDLGLEAAGLAVALVGGAGEDVDLGAAVVDVIFARDVPAGEVEEARERVAEHRTADVADVHRAGGVGGDELDVDAAAGRRGRSGRSRCRRRARRGSPRTSGRGRGAG